MLKQALEVQAGCGVGEAGEAMTGTEAASLPCLEMAAWTWGSVSFLQLGCYDKLGWGGWPLLAGLGGGVLKQKGKVPWQAKWESRSL